MLTPLFLSSCQGDVDLNEINSITPHELNLTSSNSEIKKNIIVNIMSSHFGGFRLNDNTRAQSDFTLTPFTFKGDTVMYVAQYTNGWELYSTDLSVSMIICSSPYGKFNLDDPNLPDALRNMIMDQANAIYNRRQEKIETIDSSWEGLAITDDILAKGKTMILNTDGTYSVTENSQLPPGHWELIEAKEVNKTVEETGKLTKTQWGQSSPWNTYSDKVLLTGTDTYQSAPAGCGPVAMAQYVYATYQKNEVPNISSITAFYNKLTKTYIFAQAQGQKFSWNKVALKSTDPDTSTTALLIGYIGHCLSATYTIDGTSTTTDNVIDFFKANYEKPYQMLYFDKNKVITTLKNELPVFTRASSTIYTENKYETVGHAFLIDKYQKVTSQLEYTYAWIRDPLPSGTPDIWEADVRDSNGNIIKYAYIKTDVDILSEKENISMNWGWNGNYNDVLYSIDEDWQTGKYLFNQYIRIFLPQ